MSQHFNHPSYEALYQACGRSGSGDEKEVKRILDEDPSLLNKVLNSAGSTVLIYASIYNHIKIIKYLLTLDQLNINQQNHRGRTALHCASYYGYKEIVKLLLTHSDIDIHTRDKDGKLATDICCDNTSNMSNKPIILDLLNNHGDIKASSSSLSLSSTTITTVLTQYLSERNSSSYERSSTISHEDSFHQPRKYSEEVENTKIIEEVKEKELPRVDEEKESLKLQIIALENVVKEMEDQIREKEKECMELRDQVLAMGSSYETQLKQMESSNKELEKKLEKKERALQWSLGRVGKVLSLPLPPNKQTHVFLTHTWRDDEKGRNNHDRVGRVNQAIRERGLVTWFDSERMSGTVRQAMTNALDATCCVLIFITKKYEEKVNSANEGDNCYFEFNVAAHDKNLANMRIPIVMEECMLSQEGWRGRLKAEVGHQLYFDLSSDEEGVLEKQYDKLVERVVELLKERFPEVSFDNSLQTSNRKSSKRLKTSDADHRNDSSALKGSPVLFPFVQWYESLRLNEKIMFFIMIFLLSLILVSTIYQKLSSSLKEQSVTIH